MRISDWSSDVCSSDLAEGVAFASLPVVSPAGGAAVISVIPVGAPQDESTTLLMHRIRDEVIPLATAGTGLEAHVGGITAALSGARKSVVEGKSVAVLVETGGRRLIKKTKHLNP